MNQKPRIVPLVMPTGDVVNLPLELILYRHSKIWSWIEVGEDGYRQGLVFPTLQQAAEDCRAQTMPQL